MEINKISINNLRCFSKITAGIRPFTVIVGENNSGKTTFLSAYKLIHDLVHGNKLVQPSSIEDLLKDERYKYLGGSRDIIRKQSSDDTIKIGGTLKAGAQDIWNVEYFIKNGKNCEKVLIHSSGVQIHVELKADTSMLNLMINNKTVYDSTTPDNFSIHFFRIIGFLSNNVEVKQMLQKDIVLHSKISTLLKFRDSENVCNFLEPGHLKPKKQYNHAEIPTTDPAYILCKMAQMKIKKTNSWEEVNKEFNKFGKASKLFQNIGIDVLDKKNSESPFSIKVMVDNLKSDITNVGYGVSQFLPVLANVLLSDPVKYHTFLMQQPETHLHPKVEAEFTSLMINMINMYKKYKFICETHSDYIVQRARIQIQKKILNPKDFLILYFELKNGEAKNYPITIDGNGNIENAPPGYQEFFLSEDYELLGL